MKTMFIEQKEKNDYNFLHIKEIKKIKNKIVIHSNINKTSFYKKIRITNKICKILEKEKIKQVLISRELKNNIQFLNLLESKYVKICNKEWFLKQFVLEIIDCILNKYKLKKEEIIIYICLNTIDSKTEEYLYRLTSCFKGITVVTKNIGSFKIIEKNIYDKNGMLINITNNKEKALAKSKIILNFDFTKEDLNQFIINNKSIILNIKGMLTLKKKNFSGKIINDINIDIKENDEILNIIDYQNLKAYDIKDVCQAFEIKPDCEISI